MNEIQRMQDNLLLIRRAAGWSAEEFGDRIGVTRQTINNIENGRSRLTKTQYIAMRSVLDAEMAKCPDDTEMLCMVLEVFVDHPEKYKKEDRTNLLDKANLVTPSILAGTATRKAASKEWMKAAASLGVVTTMAFATGPLGMGLVGGATGAWLMKAAYGADVKNRKEPK